MTSIKTAISIEESLYQEADALAKAMNIPRSQLFAIAMAEFLRRQKNRQLVESVNEAYTDDLDESENIMLEKMRQHQGKLQQTEW
jgi:metal-responsive CopG/Arc/MetJ family transcriptional regulator